MPDNKKNNGIDEQFTNLAWAEMRKLLEEEMPVTSPPKKRRYLLLFLLFFLVLGGLTTLWAIQDQRSSEEKEASIQAVATLQGSTQKEKEIIEETENCPEVKNHDIVENKNTKVTTIYKNPNTKTVASSDLISPTPVQIVSPIETLPTAPILPTVQELDQTNNIIQSDLLAFSKLPSTFVGLDYVSLLEEDLNSPKTKKQSAFVAALMPTKFGVEGGALSNQLTQIDGYHLGLTAKYNLKANHWAIHTGVSYAIQNHSYRFGRRNGNADELSLSFDSNGENINVGNSVQDTIATVSNPGSFNAELDSLSQYVTTAFSARVQRLEVPILMSYRADDRLHFDFGLQASYVLAAKTTRDEIVPFFDGLYRSSSTFNQTQAAANKSGFSAKNVNRFDLAIRGGISYYPTKNIGLRLHYQFGLINTSESDRYRSHNRSLKLSSIYYF